MQEGVLFYFVGTINFVDITKMQNKCILFILYLYRWISQSEHSHVTNTQVKKHTHAESKNMLIVMVFNVSG